MMIDDPYAWSDTGSFEEKSGFVFIVTTPQLHWEDRSAVLILYVDQQDNKMHL